VPSSPRGAALRALLRVERDGAYAAAALDAELARSRMSPSDRGLATDLVLGVLRWRGALDARIARWCHRPIEQLDLEVLVALRLGAYQLAGHLRVPPHAAVNETVALVRSARRTTAAAGLVNAVLRGISGSPEPLTDARQALPEWIFTKLERAYGPEQAHALAAWSTEAPWTGLRVNPRRGSREELIERLRVDAPDAVLRPGERSPLAVLARSLGPVAALASYREGWFAVQDEGAQVCALLLDLEPGQHVLDACAGRGGKTTLLASMADGRATLDAADRSPRKLEHLAAEIERLGLGGLRTVSVDLEVGSGDLRPPYDRILADVPCSGTGTLSRRPEIRWRLTPGDVERLIEAQRVILDRCLSMLAPHGVLVYCACSLFPEEGVDQVRLAIQRHPGLRLDREVTLLPHRDGTDGFHAARLVRQDNAQA
jgi:16S rRNA (cytosine967-C5)-methyltransferase